MTLAPDVDRRMGHLGSPRPSPGPPRRRLHLPGGGAVGGAASSLAPGRQVVGLLLTGVRPHGPDLRCWAVQSANTARMLGLRRFVADELEELRRRWGTDLPTLAPKAANDPHADPVPAAATTDRTRLLQSQKRLEPPARSAGLQFPRARARPQRANQPVSAGQAVRHAAGWR